VHLSSEQHGHAMPHHLPSVCRTELQSKYYSKCVESDEISQQLEAVTPAPAAHRAPTDPCGRCSCCNSTMCTFRRDNDAFLATARRCR
jgi:hypothetical protein